MSALAPAAAHVLRAHGVVMRSAPACVDLDALRRRDYRVIFAARQLEQQRELDLAEQTAPRGQGQYQRVTVVFSANCRCVLYYGLVSPVAPWRGRLCVPGTNRPAAPAAVVEGCAKLFCQLRLPLMKWLK